MQLDISPITSDLGVIVRNPAGELLANGVPGQIRVALERHNLLVFPQIGMNDALFLELTAALGEKHENDVTADGSEASDKGIFRIALDRPDKTQLDFIKGNDYWHMDGMSYSVPCKATLLKCESAPLHGGDTGFANLHAAYDALTEHMKSRLDGLRVGHCMAAVGRKLYAQPKPEDFERWDRIFPRLEHPLVWNQSDGRSALLIGSTANDIVGLEAEAGQGLLEELLDWCTQERFTYRHRWRQGDLVIFHNPGLLHRSYPYSNAAQRVMHRTTLKGTEEIASAALQGAIAG